MGFGHRIIMEDTSLLETAQSTTREETAKTILLERDPPYHKKDGGLFLYRPPFPTSKYVVLVVL